MHSALVSFRLNIIHFSISIQNILNLDYLVAPEKKTHRNTRGEKNNVQKSLFHFNLGMEYTGPVVVVRNEAKNGK